MRIKICAAIIVIALFANPCLAQSKKTELILKANEKPSVINQSILITDYFVISSMNSKAFFPDPLLAGSNTIINCTGTPETGSDAIALKIIFVAEAPLYPKPEYIAATKTIYLTEPISQYAIIINQLEKTIDKVGDKKLKGIFLEDAAGSSIAILQMFSEKNNAGAPQKKNDGPLPGPLPPPNQPVKQ